VSPPIDAMFRSLCVLTAFVSFYELTPAFRDLLRTLEYVGKARNLYRVFVDKVDIIRNYDFYLPKVLLQMLN
jgi:hypothetical protein